MMTRASRTAAAPKAPAPPLSTTSQYSRAAVDVLVAPRVGGRQRVIDADLVVDLDGLLGVPKTLGVLAGLEFVVAQDSQGQVVVRGGLDDLFHERDGLVVFLRARQVLGLLLQLPDIRACPGRKRTART